MYKPVVNMADIKACSKKALIMKDMGNGHTRPFMWGSEVTISGASLEIARGDMGGVFVDDCIYLITPTNVAAMTADFYVDKDAGTHTVSIKKDGAPAVNANFDVLVFMSTATTVTVSDYAGKRGYQTGNY